MPTQLTSPGQHAVITAPDSVTRKLLRLLPGLAVSATLACIAMLLAQMGWLQSHGLSALTLAIVLGILAGNLVQAPVEAAARPGVNLSKQTLLRLGVVLYGLRLTVQDIGQVGVTGVAIDALVLCSTFGLACLIGVKVLGIDRKTSMLIGAGSSICGAAAVMATEPLVKARADQVAVAVSTVVLFGTIAMFLYPFLFELNQHWHWIAGDSRDFGLYAGATIHEVAQVVAASASMGPDAMGTAVIAKMVRVMMLAPFLILLSAALARGQSATEKAGLSVPWFAFAFLGVVLFNSLQWLPADAVAWANTASTALLATAMAALGWSTRFTAMRQAGLKPLLLALILFIWLVVGGGLIHRLVFSLQGAG